MVLNFRRVRVSSRGRGRASQTSPGFGAAYILTSDVPWPAPNTCITRGISEAGGPTCMAGDCVHSMFRCRTCGPLPASSFDQSVLKRGKSGDCKACRKRANALHHKANKWRRVAVAPGVCAPGTDPKALVAEVLAASGGRCALSGVSGKPLVVVRRHDDGRPVPVLRMLYAYGVAAGGVLAWPSLFRAEPASPAPAPVSPPPPPSSAAPEPDAPLPAPTSADAAAAVALQSPLAERLAANRAVVGGGGLITKGGIVVRSS